MCGFGGILNGNEAQISVQRLQEIANKVSFRGPDNTTVKVFNNDFQNLSRGNIGFFFNRLAIIDLEPRSNQPFEDNDHLLLFNGEIYNYNSLKPQLQKFGVKFTTTSDTEVLFYALQVWKEDAVEKLNGMFAFFWINKRTKEFLIGRDRLGIKPLYYKNKDSSFAFASELDSIVRFSNGAGEISQDSVASYLRLQYVPTPHTILKDVHKLPPGNLLKGRMDNNGTRILSLTPYWDSYKELQQPNGAFVTTSFEDLLKESVKSQLQSDVPLGLFLSSGVDSSLLAAVVNKYFSADLPVNFFTVAFEESTSSDESALAAAFIKGFNNPNLKHDKLVINAEMIRDKILDFYNYYDEPFGDYAGLLNWVISMKAREKVTVALSGDGADELFWGYPRYDFWRSHNRRSYKKFPFLVNSKSLLDKMLPYSRSKYKLIHALEKDPVNIYFNSIQPKSFGFLPTQDLRGNDWVVQGLDEIKTREDLAAIIDLKAYLPDAMLYKVDRASMAASLEVRVPYLDNNIINYSLHTPLNQKIKAPYYNKSILKETLFRLAPHYDLSQPKKGFNLPLDKWIATVWKEMIMDHLTKDNLTDFGLDFKIIGQIITEHFVKGKSRNEEIWYLFNLILWGKKFKTMRAHF